jgi:hypothetical protein
MTCLSTELQTIRRNLVLSAVKILVVGLETRDAGKTYLNIRLQLRGYWVRRSDVAAFTVSAPETSSLGQFISTTYASLVRVHEGHLGLVLLKRRRGY